MRAVVQRVSEASVTVDGQVVGRIGAGLCVLLGVGHGDDEAHADRMAAKLWALRIFEDGDGRMNRSAADARAGVLLISQFTLYGDTSRGRRPSFVQAAPGDAAAPLVERCAAAFRALGATVATGRFGADMSVCLCNDGPVTVIVEV